MTHQPTSVSIATPFNSEFSLASLAESALDEHAHHNNHFNSTSTTEDSVLIKKNQDSFSTDQGYQSGGASGSSSVSDEESTSSSTTTTKKYHHQKNSSGTAIRTILTTTTSSSSSTTTTAAAAAESSMASPPESPLSTSSNSQNNNHSHEEHIPADDTADGNDIKYVNNENNNNNNNHTADNTVLSVPTFVLQTSATISPLPHEPSMAQQDDDNHTTTSSLTFASESNADGVQPLRASSTAEIEVTTAVVQQQQQSSTAHGDHQRYLDPQDGNHYGSHHARVRTSSGSDTDTIDRERDFRADQEATTPTLEQMGLDKLDELELRVLLQNAYEVIQEKERHLGMAATIGQDLVESNANLHAKYQHILAQLRQQRVHRTRQLTPPRTIILSPPPELPIGSVLTVDGSVLDEEANSGDENWVDDYEPSSLLHVGASPSSVGGNSSSSFSYPTSPAHTGGGFGSNGHYHHHQQQQHHHIAFRRSASHHSGLMRSRSRQDIEKLATLEDLNAELQSKVDAITKELKQGRRQAFKRYRKAEREFKAVKDELDRTSAKVIDLEEQNGRLIEASRQLRQRRIHLKNQLPAPGSIPGSTMVAMAVEMQGDEMTLQEMLAEDNRIFEELRDRLQSLERKNAQLAHQRTEAEKRSQQLQQDLLEGEKEQEDLITSLSGYADLQVSFEEQKAHIKQLENQNYELQNQISTMSSRLSQANSPMLSPTEPSSPIQSVWRRDDADFKALKTILHGSSPGPMGLLKSPGLKGQRRPRRTLLEEFESEWFRDVSFFGPRVTEQQQIPTIQMDGNSGAETGGRKHGKRALKNHRHESESESFTDDTGGRVKGWRRRIQDADYSDEACESSSCVRKQRSTGRRGSRFKFAGESDTDHQGQHTHGEDSDVDRYQLRRRRTRHRHRSNESNSGSVFESGSGLDEDPFEVDDGLSDYSDLDHHNQERPDTPGCCCHLYEDEYSGYSSYDDDEMHMLHDRDDEESVVGWSHFMDHESSTFGYDQRRDAYYLGRRPRGGIFGMIQSAFLLLRLIWRWCRFIGILSTALGIAIYRGPDALLTDGHY
ncbi:hypothetical protein BGZ83_003488 [Gryganskiella cystojenkinii]|nr:hypothetical protein BGZ83_003488 [Gryganskiella cystojenkinii]